MCIHFNIYLIATTPGPGVRKSKPKLTETAGVFIRPQILRSVVILKTRLEVSPICAGSRGCIKTMSSTNDGDDAHGMNLFVRNAQNCVFLVTSHRKTTI